MSLYNTLFGTNPYAAAIIWALDLTPADCGRFRDCFVTNDEIAIYTRNGGGNRDTQGEAIRRMQQHPNYLRDKDDSYDNTYATFYFSFPEDLREELKALDQGDFDPSARWVDKIEEIKRKRL